MPYFYAHRNLLKNMYFSIFLNFQHQKFHFRKNILGRKEGGGGYLWNCVYEYVYFMKINMLLQQSFFYNLLGNCGYKMKARKNFGNIACK
jgi:hypothetical protein